MVTSSMPERKKLDERIHAALSYANVHPDMEAYKRGLESQAEFDAAVVEITEIDGCFEIDIPSLPCKNGEPCCREPVKTE